MRRKYKGKRITGHIGDYVVFDLETTGINQEIDQIIEISALKVKDHVIVDRFSTLVNPGMPIPEIATVINKITDEMVAAAPTVGEVISDFLEFVGEDVLIGHNIHNFDINFIYDAALKHLNYKFSNSYIDTLFMARKCLPELAHHRLTDISKHFGIETAGAHRAMQDCIMTQLCYEKLGEIEEKLEEEERARRQLAGGALDEEKLICPECGANLVRRKGKYGYFYGCEGFPLCRYTRNQ